MLDSILSSVHVIAGSLAVLSGVTALLVRKGTRPHRFAGRSFFAAMSVTALVGAYVALLAPETLTVLAGVFTFYLVVSAWAAVKRKPAQSGVFEFFLGLWALSIAIAGFLFGMEALNSPDGLKDSFSSEPFFFFGGLALLAGILDLYTIVRRGISGAQRLARHLWRMCFALFIAVGSLFTGPGAQVFPDSLRESGLLAVPENLVLVMMFGWLAWVLFGRRLKK